MFSIYTGYSGSTLYNYVSNYFDGFSYTNELFFSPEYYPFSLVIDLQTGEVLAMDQGDNYLSTSDILSAVSAANSD